MARPLRIEYPHALYHVTARGNERRVIYRDRHDRAIFLNLLADVKERFNWLVHAYCLMDNHYHLLLETPDANLSNGMRQLNGVYTQRFNHHHRRVGHLLQGRYTAILVQKESHFLEVARYIVLNPVRANVVDDPQRWEWSSLGGTTGTAPAHTCLFVDDLLAAFSRRKSEARRRYRQFVHDGMGGGSIWEQATPVAIGDETFVEQIATHATDLRTASEIPRRQRLADRPTLEKLFDNTHTRAERNRTLVAAVYEHGYRQQDVARHLGVHYSTVSRLLKAEMSKVKT